MRFNIDNLYILDHNDPTLDLVHFDYDTYSPLDTAWVIMANNPFVDGIRFNSTLMGLTESTERYHTINSIECDVIYNFKCLDDDMSYISLSGGGPLGVHNDTIDIKIDEKLCIPLCAIPFHQINIPNDVTYDIVRLNLRTRGSIIEKYPRSRNQLVITPTLFIEFCHIRGPHINPENPEITDKKRTGYIYKTCCIIL